MHPLGGGRLVQPEEVSEDRGEHVRQTGRLVAAKLHARCLPQTLQVAGGIR